MIWRLVLSNKTAEDNYRELLRNNRVLTVSQFDHQILEDVQNFISKHTNMVEVTSLMIQSMKVVLSFYEKKTEQVLSDYLYLLCVTLVLCFADLHFLLAEPAELIGMFFKMVELVEYFDPFVKMAVKQDENYENTMVSNVMDLLQDSDEELFYKLKEYLEIDPERRVQSSFAVIIKRFVHSLGFELLNVDSVMFVWDNLFMKAKPERAEIFLVFVALLLSLKGDLLLASKWEDVVDVILLKSKVIKYDIFEAKYIEVFMNLSYYNLPFEIDDIPTASIQMDKVIGAEKAQRRYRKVGPGMLATFDPNMKEQENEEESSMRDSQKGSKMEGDNSYDDEEFMKMVANNLIKPDKSDIAENPNMVQHGLLRVDDAISGRMGDDEEDAEDNDDLLKNLN